MDGEAIKRIQGLVEEAYGAQLVESANGVQLSRRQLHRIDESRKLPTALTVHTLDALADYLTENPDELELGRLAVHIADAGNVNVISTLLAPESERAQYLTARAVRPADSFRFGEFLDVESANILVQALFAEGEQRAIVLKLLGNVRDELLKTQADDGVKQEVTVRSGVQVLEKTVVPNPVTLAPFRTFPEVEQPESPFIFRLRKNPQGGVSAALFEADGGAWMLVAIERVREYLSGKLPAGVRVLS